MIKPNPNIAAMAAYALPDITTPDDLPAVILAQNEHPHPPSQQVRAAVNAALDQAQLYPDSNWCELRGAIADVHRLDRDRIICGSGSMELMQNLVLAYLSPQDRVLVSEYGYLFMRTLVKIAGSTLDVAAEKDFHVDVDAMLAAVQQHTRLVFVVNPGNPCGSLIHNDEIRRLREGLPEQVLLLVDEAYAEYVAPGYHDDLFDLVDRGNTIVTRTFSKIYGLAGLRVGWGYFPADIRDNLRKVLIPSSVSRLSQVAAHAAMLDQAAVVENRAETLQLREYLSLGLKRLGLAVVPSHTNFVLVDFASREAAASAFEFLRARAIVVRPMGGYGLPNRLRISIGLRQQLQQTLYQLGNWQEQNNG